MKLTAASIAVAAVLAAPMARAATPDVKEFEAFAAVADECAKYAAEIASMKVPEGHAEARLMKAANEKIEKTKGMAAQKAQSKIEISEVHVRFMKDIEDRTKKLDECGVRFEKARADAKSLEAKLSKLHLGEDDFKPVEASMRKYLESRETLHQAIAKLSEDRQIQSYVHKTVAAHFIHKNKEDQEKDGEGK